MKYATFARTHPKMVHRAGYSREYTVHMGNLDTVRLNSGVRLEVIVAIVTSRVEDVFDNSRFGIDLSKLVSLCRTSQV